MDTDGAADPALITLAQSAGILTRWEDAAGRLQHVSEPVLRSLLQALDLPCMTPSQISDSMHQLEQDRAVSDGDMVVLQVGETPHLRCTSTGRWQLTLESGRVVTGTLIQGKPGWVSLSPVSEHGYHTLTLDGLTLTLAVVPQRCPEILSAPGQPRPWGLVAQIYSLQNVAHPEAACGDAYGPSGRVQKQLPLFDVEGASSAGQRALPAWTEGSNFSAVSTLAAHAAQEGASALALSPVHAMFSADPARYSPYSPSSRLFLNVCYSDPAQVLGAELVQHALSNWSYADVLDVSYQTRLLDWPRIASLRIRLLRDVFAHFSDYGSTQLKEKFKAFRQESGAALHHHAIYEALHAYHAPALGLGHGWQDWPLALQDPASPQVTQFAKHYNAEVMFHTFAQWLAFEGLHQAQASARLAGMSCGLISDLAIGTDPRGSHAWSLQRDILTRVSVGAPPDVFQPLGQNWGLTAFSPRGLRRGAYAAFIATLRANLRCAGGIRIDHVAGMERLWLIPDGATAAEGAYLTYPRRELLGLITLEAARHDAIVIGENLGTVSDELNRSITKRGILGTNVLWFEQEAASPPVSVAPFRSAQQWSEDAVAMPSTHDLPTIRGWWQERDIQWRTMMGQLTRVAQKSAQDERALQRADLWRAVQHEGCAPKEITMPPDETPLSAILSFVARAPGPMALFSLEDVLGVIDQPNIPGAAAEHSLIQHPNWIQQLPVSVDDMFADPAVLGRIGAVRQARSIP